MLDAHPRIAVPPESHFVVGLGRRYARRFDARATEALLRHGWFINWGLDRAEVERAIARARVSDFAGLMRVVFSLYAETHGKSRWGDKTPWYISYIDLLGEMFPDASFVHLVRDGREVAVSIVEQEWGPDSPAAAAFNWRKRVSDGLAAGGRLGPGRYYQLRLEDLVRSPDAELTKLCAFLKEEFEPQMLDYHSGLAGVELDPAHPHLRLPPTEGLRDWTATTTPAERVAIESICAPLLEQLGYGPATRSISGLARAYGERIRYRLAHLDGVKQRFNPRREF
jgi:hypothetical protein